MKLIVGQKVKINSSSYRTNGILPGDIAILISTRRGNNADLCQVEFANGGSIYIKEVHLETVDQSAKVSSPNLWFTNKP